MVVFFAKLGSLQVIAGDLFDLVGGQQGLNSDQWDSVGASGRVSGAHRGLMGLNGDHWGSVGVTEAQ